MSVVVEASTCSERSPSSLRLMASWTRPTAFECVCRTSRYPNPSYYARTAPTTTKTAASLLREGAMRWDLALCSDQKDPRSVSRALMRAQSRQGVVIV